VAPAEGRRDVFGEFLGEFDERDLLACRSEVFCGDEAEAVAAEDDDAAFLVGPGHHLLAAPPPEKTKHRR